MRKALNFDLDTKKYEYFTNKKAPTAYVEIRKFLNKNDFEHRQGPGYISKNSLNDGKVFAIIQNMAIELEWLKSCTKQIDVTNIGKQHSLIDVLRKTLAKDNLSNLNDIEF